MSYTDLEYKFKKIGKNVSIGRNVYFRYPHLVEIGDNVIIDEFCYFTSAIKIGNNVHLAPYVSSIGGSNSKLIVGDFCSIAAGVKFVCKSDNFYSNGLANPTIPSEFKDEDNNTKKDVEIGKFVIIGTNAVILPSVKVGDGVSIGALSLVRKDLESFKVYAGNPLRILGERNGKKILEQEQNFLDYLECQ